MKKKLLAVALIALVAGIAVGYAVEQLLIPTVGNLVTEFNLEANPATINWGDVYVGVPVWQVVTITNVGTQDIATLNMTHGNPSATIVAYTLTWNATDVALPKGAFTDANFTLTVTDGSAGAISLDIWIQE